MAAYLLGPGAGQGRGTSRRASVAQRSASHTRAWAVAAVRSEKTVREDRTIAPEISPRGSSSSQLSGELTMLTSDF